MTVPQSESSGLFIALISVETATTGRRLSAEKRNGQNEEESHLRQFKLKTLPNDKPPVNTVKAVFERVEVLLSLHRYLPLLPGDPFLILGSTGVGEIVPAAILPASKRYM